MKTPTLEAVLDAFAMEADYGKETLAKYLERYPQFAIDIVDLSRQLERPVVVDTSPPSARVVNFVDTAWRVHVAARPATANDPLSSLDLAKNRELARMLDLPRQVITAFTERRVQVASVPKRFLSQLAGHIGSSVDSLVAAMSLQPTAQPMRSYSSDEKPVAPEQVTFEQLLIDANVSAERRAALLAEGD